MHHYHWTSLTSNLLTKSSSGKDSYADNCSQLHLGGEVDQVSVIINDTWRKVLTNIYRWNEKRHMFICTNAWVAISGLVKTHIPLNPLTTPTYISVYSHACWISTHTHLLTHAEYLQHTVRECIPSMAIIDRLSFTTGITTIRNWYLGSFQGVP